MLSAPPKSISLSISNFTLSIFAPSSGSMSHAHIRAPQLAIFLDILNNKVDVGTPFDFPLELEIIANNDDRSATLSPHYRMRPSVSQATNKIK